MPEIDLLVTQMGEVHAVVEMSGGVDPNIIIRLMFGRAGSNESICFFSFGGLPKKPPLPFSLFLSPLRSRFWASHIPPYTNVYITGGWSGKGATTPLKNNTMGGYVSVYNNKELTIYSTINGSDI